MNGSILQTERDYSNTLPVLHDEVQGKVLNEVVAVVSEKVNKLSKRFHGLYIVHLNHPVKKKFLSSPLLLFGFMRMSMSLYLNSKCSVFILVEVFI